jgi:hypothetical protein
MISRLVALTVLGLALGTAEVRAQGDQLQHHARSNLYAAALDGLQVVPPKDTTASGTAVLIVDAGANTLRYDITYRGLRGGASQIALRNFGRGANGKTIETFCGGTSGKPCPTETAATLRGSVNAHDAPILADDALKELALGRSYIEIEVGGIAEIRGQFDNRDLMAPVERFVSRLGSTDGGGATGTGVFVLTPGGANGRTRLNYLVTVTEGRPEELVLNPTPFATLRIGTNDAAAGFKTEGGATLIGSVDLPVQAQESFELRAEPRRVTVSTDGKSLTGSLEPIE